MVKSQVFVTLEAGTRFIVWCLRLKTLWALTVIDGSMFNIIELKHKTTLSGFSFCELAFEIMN